MWKILAFSLFGLFLPASGSLNLDPIFVSELFSLRIDATFFNWSSTLTPNQYVFRPSLEGYPDLPSWMRYMYSEEHRAGFLYGTPPDRLAGKEVRLEIVGLNRQTFETRQIILSMWMTGKIAARNVVQMKIDNLDWVHLMDPGRIENLKNIYQKDLWPESAKDLHIVFMEAATKMGARLPVLPQLHEGVIVHLGSNAMFSERLLELQEEVKPLYKISTCNYKRTSVQTTFENGGFRLDWCAFRIVGDDTRADDSLKNTQGFGHDRGQDRWQGISRSDAPQRNYIDEFTFAVAIPGMILAILIALLSCIFCFQHKSIDDPHSEYFFETIFHICKEFRERKNPTVPIVKLTQDSANYPQTTLLKSLKDAPNLNAENLSLHSQSPIHAQDTTTDSNVNVYMRPKPPPYKRNGVHI
uniref:Putative epsilon-sarcoglycan isoform x1 n=1 Tax=Lutzomyia longipalpis TaxID=7200 RepID=A0A7G3AFM5_LUTLO